MESELGMDPAESKMSEPANEETTDQLLLELKSMCLRLEALGEDALVLTTWDTTVLGVGSSVATLFIQPDLLKQFQVFCTGKRKEMNGWIKDDIQPRKPDNVTHNHDQVDLSFTDRFIAGNSETAVGDSIDDIADDSLQSLDHGVEEPTKEDDASKSGEVVHFSDTDIPIDEYSKKSPELDFVNKDVKSVTNEKKSVLLQTKHGKKTDKPTANVVEQKRSTRLRNKEQDNKQKKRKKVVDDAQNAAKDTVDKETDSDREIDESIMTASENMIQIQGEWLNVISAKEAGIEDFGEETKLFKCFKCEKKTQSIGRLREHFTKMHKIKIGHICVCGRYFPENSAFQKHIESSRYKMTHFSCKNCGKFFEDEIHMKIHVKDMHEIETAETKGFGEYPCLKCGTIFQHQQHLRLHNKSFEFCDRIKQDDETVTDVLEEVIVYKDKTDGPDITVKFKTLVEKAKKSPFKCTICKTSFERKSNFTRHLMTHLSSGVLSCNICAMKFRVKDSLVKHMRDHVKKPYKCDYCRARFPTDTELSEHIRRLCRGGERENFRCDLCEHTAGSMAALTAHKNTHAGLKLFGCKECGKQLATQSSLDRHMITLHQDEALFKCEHCDKKFKVKDSLNKHKRVHEEPRYHCELCGKACVEFGNLKKHMMTHTKERPFVCEICGSTYGRKSLLESHRRIHTGETPYKCTKEGCEKGFRSYGNLQQHIRSHATNHPYVCDICGKMFKQPGRLSHHRKDHLVDFRWPCAYCPAKFKSIFMYKNHLAKTHPEKKSEIEKTSNIRLYECEQCKKMYGDKEDYTRHMYIHLGLKPFKCQYCEKAFNDKSNLKQHEKIHTGDKKFQCASCQKAFIHKKTLRIHSEKCHGMRDIRDGEGDVKQQHVRCERIMDTINPDSHVNVSGMMEVKTSLQLVNPHGASAGSEAFQTVEQNLPDGQQIQIFQPHDLRLSAAPVTAVNVLTGEPLIIVENFQ